MRFFECGMNEALKLAAVDLDGTLLGPDKTISPENLAALQCLHAAGIEILVATGRHLTRISNYLPHIPNARWAVTCQGAAVHEIATRFPIRSLHLGADEARRLIDTGSRLGLTSIVYAQDLVRTTQDGEFVELYGSYAGGLPLKTTDAELTGIPAHKIVWLGSGANIDRLPELPEIHSIPLYQVRTHENIYEFLPSAATKATGVAAIAEQLGIRPAQVIAFGDADNDIPMFGWAGQSFAMSHGSAAAHRAARLISPDGPPESAFARAVATLDLPPCSTRN